MAKSIFVSTSGIDLSSTTGSEDSPFATVNFAMKYANPGDTIVLLPGKHQPISLDKNPDYKNGTKEHPIRVISKEKWRALVSEGKPHGISCSLDWIEFDGLHVFGCYGDGIKTYGSNNSINNCWIHHNRGQGIGMHNADVDLAENVPIGGHISRCLIEHNGTNPKLDHGIYASGLRIIISSNIIRHNCGWGIQLYSGASMHYIIRDKTDPGKVVSDVRQDSFSALCCSVVNNVVVCQNNHGDTGGIILRTVRGGGGNNIINNTVVWCTRTAIFIEQAADPPPSEWADKWEYNPHNDILANNIAVRAPTMGGGFSPIPGVSALSAKKEHWEGALIYPAATGAPIELNKNLCVHETVDYPNTNGIPLGFSDMRSIFINPEKGVFLLNTASLALGTDKYQLSVPDASVDLFGNARGATSTIGAYNYYKYMIDNAATWLPSIWNYASYEDGASGGYTIGNLWFDPISAEAKGIKTIEKIVAIQRGLHF